ncbi:polysaccharide pyruvyl transferase family protein [Vibrio nigripulchritudo]|uniref:polysaccharide pyruvyl transferase family protein n=1 Tax=Vibrio nigripulchritudo TaxID=28173 RepID=UPI0003B1D748|nr:polysaccharide pyruvyl transferase family protein [Vibrio nigripulchritudo]CCN69984.1 putative exopolysaccharide biosynthesis protein [Vibrio nigripulchritudo SFn118]
MSESQVVKELLDNKGNIVRLYSYKGKHPNFGDDINQIVWENLLGEVFDNRSKNIFLGIGSILYNSFPQEVQKIVMGAGYAGYTDKPKIDNSWDIHFVRGKETAKQLNLPESLAVGDSAILLRSLIDFENRKTKYKVSYMPHFESAWIGAWDKICEACDIHYLDPRRPVNELLEEMLSSELIISEAMHGVIVADALRIPWVARTPQDPNHRDKWFDWASVLDVDLQSFEIGPSNVMEKVSSLSWGHRRIIYKMRKHHELLRSIGLGRPLKKTIEEMNELKLQKGTLSSDKSIEEAHSRMLDILESFKEKHGIAHKTPEAKCVESLFSSRKPNIQPNINFNEAVSV